MTVSLADRIRHYVSDACRVPARAAGLTDIVVTSGDIHRDMGPTNRMPAVCAALDAGKFADEYDVVASRRTGP